MAFLHEPKEPVTAPVAVDRPRKPSSAVCCHTLAALSFLGFGWLLFLAIGAQASGYEVAGALSASVFWWALGDIVSAVNRTK